MRRAGTAGLVLVFAAGAWLIAAPFVLRFQPSGAHWTGASRMDVAIGAVLVLAAFAGLFAALAGWAGEIYAAAGQQAPGARVRPVFVQQGFSDVES